MFPRTAVSAVLAGARDLMETLPEEVDEWRTPEAIGERIDLVADRVAILTALSGVCGCALDGEADRRRRVGERPGSVRPCLVADSALVSFPRAEWLPRLGVTSQSHTDESSIDS